jgi:hypothetical protein
MYNHDERVFFIVKRIEELTSLSRVFDLIHFHYSTDSIPQYFKSIEEVYESQTTLYILMLSYLYSLFDKRGINICHLDETSLSKSSIYKLEEIKELWKPLKNPITRIRHNLGFHGIGSSQIKNVQKAVEEIGKYELRSKIDILFLKLESFSKQLEHELQQKPNET